ncbi:MAG: hypothetical protein RI925_1009 [Pseudomonadota bacterium]
MTERGSHNFTMFNTFLRKHSEKVEIMMPLLKSTQVLLLAALLTPVMSMADGGLDRVREMRERQTPGTVSTSAATSSPDHALMKQHNMERCPSCPPQGMQTEHKMMMPGKE